MLGVTHPTVIQVRQEMIENGELVKFTSLIGSDDIERPAEMPRAEEEPKEQESQQSFVKRLGICH